MRTLAVLIVLALVLASCAGADPSPRITDRPSLAVASGSPDALAIPSGTRETSDLADVRWERIAVVDAPDPLGDFRTLAAFDGGYVSIRSAPVSVSFSEDGVSWVESTLAVPSGTAVSARAMAGSGGSMVIVGSSSPCPDDAYRQDPFGHCRARPVSWISSNGRDWRASPAWEGPVGERGRAGSDFSSVWSVPGDGWDAAQAFSLSDESSDLEPIGPAIWHASDGLRWESFRGDLVDDGGCDADLSYLPRAAADASGRRLAAGCGPHVWSSTDGRTYAPVAALPLGLPNASVHVVLAPVEGRPWRLLGTESDGHDLTRAIAWASPDLESWTATPMPGPAGSAEVVRDATFHDGMDIAVGWDAQRRDLTWISEDGMEWRAAEQASAPIEAIAAGPAGVLGLVGLWDAAGGLVTGFEVWSLRFDA